MVKFRKHRGSLEDSMKTETQVKDKKDIAEICSDELIKFDPEKIEIKHYGFDERIQWNSFIVYYPDYGVLGFTNANID